MQNDTKPLSEGRDTEKTVDVGDPFRARRVATPLDRMMRSSSGKRSFTKTERKRGHYITSRSAEGKFIDIAVDATIREACVHQSSRQRKGMALAVEASDLRRKVRVRRAANLILFAVDASWSMAAADRMEATKGAILSLLLDAYQKRDQVGLVTFQKETARLILEPTRSVELAKKLLKDVPVGGKTPLSAGLLLANEILEQARRKDPEVMPLLILLTDGAGNVSMTGLPPREESVRVARMIRANRIRALVINTEHESLDRGLAQELADEMGAACLTLKELAAHELYRTVRDELDG